MKQKIYTLNSTFTRAHRCLLLSISFSIFGTFASAQQSSPYNSRNVNHNAAVGRLTSEATPAAVRTLSVNPAVSPNQNQLPTGAPAQTSQGIAGNIFLNNGASKIASFTGISVNGEYQLTWETVIENDVKQYTIEYSLNNQDFAVAAVVSAANRSTYTFNHIIDAAPTMYYRLRVTDRNGGNVYSNPIFINSTLARAADQVTPSIIRDGVLNITLANAYKNVQLYNNAGVEVFREYIGGRTGNRIGFNLPTLPAGAYFVKLIGTNAIVTQRIIIM